MWTYFRQCYLKLRRSHLPSSCSHSRFDLLKKEDLPQDEVDDMVDRALCLDSVSIDPSWAFFFFFPTKTLVRSKSGLFVSLFGHDDDGSFFDTRCGLYYAQ